MVRSDAPPPVHIRFGGYRPPVSVHSRAAAVLAQALAARLGGAVRFDLDGDVVASGRPAADLLALVERGQLTMCYFSTSYLARRVPEFALLAVPFVLDRRERAYALLYGALGSLLANRLEAATGYRVLGYWDNGFRHLTNRVRPDRHHPPDGAGDPVHELPRGHGRRGALIVALLITMVAALILGTALPTTPAYIMLAALLIPALIKLGVPPLAAHMFVFYFGCLSSVTPPECLAVYAAASISRCSVWGAGWQAVKFAAAGFIVPFFFVDSPALLFEGPWAEITRAVVTGTIGVVALVAAVEGYFVRPASWLERGLFMAAAFSLIDPGFYTDVAGLVALAAGLASQKLRRPAVVVASVGGR